MVFMNSVLSFRVSYLAENSRELQLPARWRPRPDIVFADEPTGNLDQQSGKDVLGLLKMMKEEWGQTILLVTHDMEIAQTADRVIEIRDGMVVRKGV